MLQQPLIVPINEEEYELVEDYSYRWTAEGYEQFLLIQKGFIHDGASIPRIAWSLTGITPDGLHRAAALVHDFIYKNKGNLPDSSHFTYGKIGGHKVAMPAAHVWTRKEADRMFCRLMREAGVSKFRRRLMFWAVRSFGWAAWK